MRGMGPGLSLAPLLTRSWEIGEGTNKLKPHTSIVQATNKSGWKKLQQKVF